MKMKTIITEQQWKWRLAKKIIEQKNGGNDNCKYGIRGFKRNFPVAVDVSVYIVLFFVLSVCWFFENKLQTKIKLKVSVF